MKKTSKDGFGAQAVLDPPKNRGSGGVTPPAAGGSLLPPSPMGFSAPTDLSHPPPMGGPGGSSPRPPEAPSLLFSAASGLTAGVDEAGRGCLAGPVAAAAVILPERFDLPGLTDSKKLSPAERAGLEGRIKAQALAWSLGLAWPREIEAVNILQATLQAMRRAVLTLGRAPGELLIDGISLVPLPLPQRAIKGGDLLIPAISAASILAKTFRDKLMAALDRRYPGYGFAQHKGYGVPVHLKAIQELGPCRIHRMTFRGVRPESAQTPEEPAGLPSTRTQGVLWPPNI